MTRVTLRLPDDLYQRLQVLSQQSGASLNGAIVSTLNEALSPHDSMPERRTRLQDEISRLRVVLADLLVDEEDSEFFSAGPREDSVADRMRFLESMPRLDPPLSQTIIEEREDRF